MRITQNRLFGHYWILLVSLLLLPLLPISGFAAEIQVPSQFPTIQAAIDASQDGDVVIVLPGTYAENINFNGKAITLTSTNPLDPTIVANTIIDGSMNGSVVTFDSEETSNSVLTGFTIRNGNGTLINGKRYGGGIFCGLHAFPTIRHNKIVNNTADMGGGIYIHGDSPPVITNGPNADYPYLNKSQMVGLSVTATDPDGDVLVYSWVPREGGTITGTGSTVSFSAATAGVYHIDLTVDDQHGGKATGTVTVTVIGIAIQAIPQLKVGQSASVSATLIPPVANSPEYPVSITWSVTEGPAAGTFDAAVNGTPQATSINFTPSASGPGRIQATYQVGMVSTNHSAAIVLNPIVLSIDLASGKQSETIQATITGNNLGRVTGISLSGSGVTASIREGKTENSLPVQFVISKEAIAGNRTINLITPEGQFSTSLTFQIVALPPITSNPTSLNIVVGNTGPIVFSIPVPAPSGGVNLTLSSSTTSVATVPASATIPQGQTSVQVIATSVGVGTATITADATAYSKVQVPVTVANSPLTGYFYRKTLTIDHTKVPSTLTNFPVLVSIPNDSDLKNHVTSVNGYDIIFMDAGGNKLNHEVEKWDGSTGTVVAWVKVPVLSSTTDTVIYMWYGNSWVTTSQENKPGVWDANYKGVWHLPNGTALSANDSTSNANNGTNHGATAAAGKIDGAGSLDGTDDYISFNQSALENVFASGSPWTINLWVMPGRNPASWAWIWCKAYTSHNDPYYQIDLKQYPPNIIGAYIWSTSYYGTGAYLSQQATVTSGVWSKVDIVGQGGGTFPFLSLYVNGNLIGTDTSPNGSYAHYSTPITLGMDANIIGGYYAFAGSIDESRISNVARSADWILTEYRNQSSLSTFFMAGSEQINHAPVAQSQNVTVNQDTAKGITLVATDSDGDPLTYQIVTQPGHGTLSGTSPNVTYTPAAGYYGPDSFTFKANDGNLDSNVATVSIAVFTPTITNFKPSAMETDGSYLYISGIGYIGALAYHRIEKRDLNGDLVDQFDQAIASPGSLSTLKLDNTNIYVGGYRTEAGVEKAIIQKRNKNNLSSQSWEYVYSGSNYEVRDLVLLGDGVYFSGAGLGGTPVIKGKLNQSDEAQVWVFNNTQTASDGISTDGSFIYVHKRTGGYATIEKVNPINGSVLGTKGYSAGNFSKGEIVDGYLYVAGNLNTLGVNAQALVEKVIPAGNSQWQIPYPTVPGGSTNVYDKAICDGSDVYVVGKAPASAPGPTTRIAKHSTSNGAEIWGVNHPTTTKASYGGFCHLGAYLYVAGWDGDPAKQCFWLEKRNKLDGSLIWARP